MLRSGASPGLPQPVLLCTESLSYSGDHCGCRTEPEVFAEDSGCSVWLRKNNFAVSARQMLCAYPVHGRSQSPRDDKGVLALEGWDADEKLFELFEVSLVSFFLLFFFFPCGFLLSYEEQKSNFPCRSSLDRTRTLLNCFTYSPYSKESSCGFLRSPDSIALGSGQSEPLSGEQRLQLTEGHQAAPEPAESASMYLRAPQAPLSSGGIDLHTEILMNFSFLVWTYVTGLLFDRISRGDALQ